MPTLIDLRRRIKSVKNSQKITQAMKTVSMAKFKKAHRSATEARPYWHVFPEVAARLASWAGNQAHPLLLEREEKKIEIVVITSDMGLAGSFNSSLLLRAEEFMEEKGQAVDMGLVLMGKKAFKFFRNGKHRVDRTYPEKTDKLHREEVRDLAEFLMKLYVFHRTDAVYLVYNEFRSILAPKITITKLLPFTFPKEDASANHAPPDWEPEARSLLGAVLPLYVESQLHHVLGESQAAEQAARMMAMENATKNAESLIEDLVLLLNKIRQAAITTELLEIITAVDALEK